MTTEASSQYRHVSPVPELFDEMVRRIAAAVRAERIVLFGSAARGDTGPDSDVDLLSSPLRRIGPRLRERSGGRCAAWALQKTSSSFTPGDIERHKNNRGLVVYPALREGEVLFVA